MSAQMLACLILVASVAMWLLAQRRQTKEWMPPRLKASRLIHVEQDLVVHRPHAVIGRPDRVFRERDGMHIPVELKRRSRVVVFDTDVAEISLRGWLLRHNGMPTARTGYIVIEGHQGRKRQAIEVVLREDTFCEELVQRYIDLTEGRRTPRKSLGPKCEKCSHARRCNNASMQRKGGTDDPGP